MKYLNHLTNVIISPICNEPVFWSVIAFALSFSHIIAAMRLKTPLPIFSIQ